MKILYLHQYFNTPDMAGGTRSYEMARRFVQWGHEVHVVTSWRRQTDKTNWFVEIIDGIHVHWLPVPYNNTMGFWARIRAFLSYAMRAGLRAATIGGDVVFATSTPLTIALPGVWASKRLSVPMVFEVRDLWPEVPIAMGILRNPMLLSTARWLERFAYSHSTLVVALSKGMAAGVAQAGFPATRIDVIPNSSDLELFSHSEAGAQRFRSDHAEIGDGPIILYPGTLGQANGVTYLVRLAHAVSALRPDLRFVVIGAGAEAEQVHLAAIDFHVLGKNFFQYPQMPKRDLVDAFSAASMVISLFVDVPALWANSANKFFDALASGTAVAINYQGWQAELLEASGAGVVLPPVPDMAAPVLAAFFDDEERLKVCGAKARQLAEEKFSRDILARKLEASLFAAIAKTPAQCPNET